MVDGSGSGRPAEPSPPAPPAPAPPALSDALGGALALSEVDEDDEAVETVIANVDHIIAAALEDERPAEAPVSANQAPVDVERAPLGEETHDEATFHEDILDDDTLDDATYNGDPLSSEVVADPPTYNIEALLREEAVPETDEAPTTPGSILPAESPPLLEPFAWSLAEDEDDPETVQGGAWHDEDAADPETVQRSRLPLNFIGESVMDENTVMDGSEASRNWRQEAAGLRAEVAQERAVQEFPESQNAPAQPENTIAQQHTEPRPSRQPASLSGRPTVPQDDDEGSPWLAVALFVVALTLIVILVALLG